MTLPREVQYAMDAGDAVYGLYSSGFIGHRHWQALRAHLLSQDAEIADLISKRDFLLRHYNAAESSLAAANALLSRCFVQIGELTKGLDPRDPIFMDLQKLGVDYGLYHLQGADDE